MPKTSHTGDKASLKKDKPTVLEKDRNNTTKSQDAVTGKEKQNSIKDDINKQIFSITQAVNLAKSSNYKDNSIGKHLDNITDAALKVTKIANQIISTQNNLKEGEYVSLSNIVQGVTALLKREKQDFLTPIAVDIESDLPQITTDQKYFSAALEEILREVINNSDKGEKTIIKALYNHGQGMVFSIYNKSLDKNAASNIASLCFAKHAFELQGIEVLTEKRGQTRAIIIKIPEYRVR